MTRLDTESSWKSAIWVVEPGSRQCYWSCVAIMVASGFVLGVWARVTATDGTISGIVVITWSHND